MLEPPPVRSAFRCSRNLPVRAERSPAQRAVAEVRREVRARRRLAALALALLAGAVGCRRPAPPASLPEVALFATVGAAARVGAEAAATRGVARVRSAQRAEDADVLWLADPTEVVEAGDAVAPGAAPPLPDVDARWKDPRGRFAPACARARVVLASPRARLPLEVANLRDLADPRLAGRVALPPLAAGAYPAALAALSVTYGEASIERFLALLARNRARLAASDDEVRADVARGDADVGLAGSEEGAAGALSAAGLEVIVPDQAGRGAVVLPTALAVARRAAGNAAAQGLVAFLTGAEAERILAARAPGLMPLRAGVPVPAGVRPAGNVVALALDWDALAAAKRKLLPRLRRWPGP
jgi:iron(III) transport system substrate-binding protein